MKSYSTFDTTATPGILTGISHLDNLLSVDKGFQSSVIFLTGTSGAGKTTLAKLIQKALVSTPTSLYERETASKSVAKQTRRIVIEHDNAMICDETEYPTFTDFMNAVEEKGIKFIIIDSLQTAATDFERNNGMGENEAQMEVLNVLMSWKKRTGGTAILIGMVKKDGDFSGLNKIKHLADCHLHLVFNEKKNVRFMQTTKNRDNSTVKVYYEFVNTDEIVVFYTEKEFELKDKKIIFDDYLTKTVFEYIEMLDKSKPSFNDFINEWNSFLNDLDASNMDTFEITMLLFAELKRLNVKYDI